MTEISNIKKIQLSGMQEIAKRIENANTPSQLSVRIVSFMDGYFLRIYKKGSGSMIEIRSTDRINMILNNLPA